MSKELQNLELFKEIQAEKFYQKKVDVANGIMEMGKILCETKEKLPHGEWLPWLEDSRVNFTERQARKYMKVYNELGNGNHRFPFDQISLRKLYALASAPEEIREDVVNNSTNSKELEENIKKYQEEKKKSKELEKQLKEQQDKHEKEIRKLEKENKELNEELDNKEPITITKTVEKIVEKQIIPEDYEELKEKAEDYDLLQYNNQALINALDKKESELKELKENEKSYKQALEQLKQTDELSKQLIDDNFKNANTGDFGELVSVGNFLKEINSIWEIASKFMYSDAVINQLDDETVQNSITGMAKKLQKIVDDLNNLAKTKKDIIIDIK